MTSLVRQSLSGPPVLDAGAIPVAQLRSDFPILAILVNGKPLVYLDNAATTQKPRAVIEALSDFYATTNANVHRGVHHLSMKATDQHEAARRRVRAFINAKDEGEVIFTRGCSEGINLVASTFGAMRVQQGDEVLISALEHHSNLVPWQALCQRVGARLVVAPISLSGELLLEEFEHLLSSRTKLVAIGHVSNALGTVNPVKAIVRIAHGRGIPVLIDGAQATPHLRVDVQDLDCDFYAFSGHKMYGPTGIGVLYGKRGHLEAMPPYQFGGDMISRVTFEHTDWNELPYKFEAGTPNVADAIGLAVAIDYIDALGLDRIAAYENELLAHASAALSEVPGITLVGTAPEKAGVLSFVMDGIHPHDIGSIVDADGIAIRAGHHCAQPLMDRLGVVGTARASFAFYNTHEEVEKLAAAVRKVAEVFA